MAAIVLAFSVFPVGSKVLAVRDLWWFFPLVQPSGEGRSFPFTYANTEAELIAELEKCGCSLYRNAN